jgi:hypothetical protein
MTIKSTYENIAAILRGLKTLESIPSLIEEATEEKVHRRASGIVEFAVASLYSMRSRDCGETGRGSC